MEINELVVASQEQELTLQDGYTARMLFDPIYKRWYYNLYKGTELRYAGIALDPDTLSLQNITDYYLGCIDKIDTKEFYEPFSELGSRLGLLEVTE